MQKKLKLGLDIHGVIDTMPTLFSQISKLMTEKGHEIHILTGAHITNEIVEELEGYGMVWNDLFSISDYHKEVGTKMWYDKNENPWIDDLDWDMTKGNYCDRNNVTIHLDDTERYGQYFKTEFIYINLEDKPQIDLPSFDSVKTEEDLIDWIKNIFSGLESLVH